MYKLREYQQRAIDALYHWWVERPGVDHAPLLVLPTGAGKSIVIAELTRLLFDTWPEDHPRTLVIVPSKELAEQNAEKLRDKIPWHLSVGFYSASVGRKDHSADVIVATIGSIAKHAHVLGNIKCVIIDEAHLVRSDGAEAGRYRQFLSDLSRYCSFRVVGLTATPFRGNGVWLTDGDDPLFTGVACTVKPQELIDAGFLSSLVPPAQAIQTRIDTSNVKTTSGDYKLDDLSTVTSAYLDGIAEDACTLAHDRHKWIAFTPSIANAFELLEALGRRGITASVVTGNTPKQERADTIAAFRAGRIRCLITVLALAVGFDVPDVDCIIWARATKSPVLYVQGAGRGMRIADGKENCLWLDFTDTTERMGPVDAIKGRPKPRKQDDPRAPYKVCPECGEHVMPASSLVCPVCGAILREEEDKGPTKASDAPVMKAQMQRRITEYPVDRVSYRVHKKAGSPDSMRVDYYSGMSFVASEWVCLFHSGFAQGKAINWWKHAMPDHGLPSSPEEAASLCRLYAKHPAAILVDESGKYPQLLKKMDHANDAIAEPV